MRRFHAHYLLVILLLLPLIVLALYTADKNAKQITRTEAQNAVPTTTVVAKNLEIPWALAFLPDGNILVTERPGRIKLVTVSTGQVTDVAVINEVAHIGEGGLLGIALHPQFASNNFLYVYYTYSATGSNTLNRVVRYTYTNNQISAPMTIVDAIPGGNVHDGGRIKFGPDGFLYITTGESGNSSLAQDQNSLAGKILRVTDTGEPAPGNPFGTRIYSYGHRNPQGIAWDGTTLYETEHGNSSPSRSDEVNSIEPGKNYGWPTIEGDATQTGMVTPLLNSGPDGTTTWAPSGTAFYNGSIFFSALKGQALYEVKVQGTTATIVNQHLKGQLGRLREAIVGPDNQLYITTSNRDGRGTPKAEDDKIIKVSFGAQTVSVTPAANPTFGVIAPCPSCLNPTMTPVIGGTTQAPTSAPVQPTTVPTIPNPSINPCEVTDGSISDNSHKHRKHRGGVSKIAEAIIEFFLKLLMLLLQLLGGGPSNNPNPVPGVTPTPAPSTASPDPCAPTGSPTSTPIPTIVQAQPTTPVVVLPTATRAPATMVPTATKAPVSVATPTPTQSLIPAAPTNPPMCIVSGQKCDATGARACCSGVCVKNINPNQPNDPGDCE